MCVNIQIEGAKNYSSLLRQFRKERGIHRIIGISGGADDKLTGVPEHSPLQASFEKFRDDLQKSVITDAVKALRQYRIAILTGGTDSGVPKIALEVAKKYDFCTIGVLPQAGEKYSLRPDFFDLRIIVYPMVSDSFWGDEGPVWTSLIDGMIVIGGSSGTLIECAHIMKINEALVKNDQRPKYMVPIHGMGGIAEQLQQIWAKPRIRDLSMPRHRVYTGGEATKLLIEALDLHECLDPKPTNQPTNLEGEYPAMATKIDPISGFAEFLPVEQIVFNRMMEVIRRNYERVGAVPVETPAVERIENLTAKGGNEKEIYRLARLAVDDGDDPMTDLALHFDLTVPLARYAVQHSGNLTFPFRRYQIQPVWRGERPQAGRYRQFYQCDIDVIGDGQLSLINDAEMPVVIYRIFQELKLGHFVISVNNRKILSGFLKEINFTSEQNIRKAMKIVDNIEKVGHNVTRDELAQLEVRPSEIDRLIEFFSIDMPTDEVISYLEARATNQQLKEGLQELKTVIGYMRQMGMPEEYFKVDPSIARGLDYYTGTVYETRLTAHPGIGSICSGGRYDELLKNLGADQDMPGVGISIGLTRLFPRLVEAGVIQTGSATIAPALVTTMDPKHLDKYLGFGADLRKAGINTEIYTEPQKLSVQMKYANRKGFDVVVIAGGDEISQGNVQVRRLSDGDQVMVAEAGLVSAVQKMIE